MKTVKCTYIVADSRNVSIRTPPPERQVDFHWEDRSHAINDEPVFAPKSIRGFRRGGRRIRGIVISDARIVLIFDRHNSALRSA